MDRCPSGPVLPCESDTQMECQNLYVERYDPWHYRPMSHISGVGKRYTICTRASTYECALWRQAPLGVIHICSHGMAASNPLVLVPQLQSYVPFWGMQKHKKAEGFLLFFKSMLITVDHTYPSFIVIVCCIFPFTKQTLQLSYVWMLEGSMA